MTSSIRVLFAAAIVSLVVFTPGLTLAAWSGGGSGNAFVKASSMPTGATPTISVSGRNVAVTWSTSTIGGASVAGYTVKRYEASTLAPQTINSSCSGTIAALTCTEAAVPPGSWKYAVIPKQGLWMGTEGGKSATATVATPSLTWTSSTTITSLPATLAGTLASYVTGETVTFRLDDASSGSILTSSISPSPVPTNGSVSFSVTIPAGVLNGGHTVYAVGSLGTQTSGGITVSIPDTTPPTISAAVINKSSGDTPSFVKQGGQYYVYANVTDTGIYASGVTTVTANVTNITTGATAVSLTAGSWTVGEVAYNYRSAVMTANAALLAGSKTFTITAIDGESNSTTQSGFSVTVDNTAPAATDIQTTNAAGGTNGLAQTGDTMVYTFSEQIDPNSIIAAWTGAARTVTFRLTDGGSANDTVTIFDAGNTTQLALGSVSLGRKDYTGANISFTNSTMVMSGSTITITLGTPSGTPTTAGNNGSMAWTPSAIATDRAANACSTTSKTEAGTADRDF